MVLGSLGSGFLGGSGTCSISFYSGILSASSLDFSIGRGTLSPVFEVFM